MNTFNLWCYWMGWGALVGFAYHELNTVLLAVVLTLKQAIPGNVADNKIWRFRFKLAALLIGRDSWLWGGICRVRLGLGSTLSECIASWAFMLSAALTWYLVEDKHTAVCLIGQFGVFAVVFTLSRELYFLLFKPRTLAAYQVREAEYF